MNFTPGIYEHYKGGRYAALYTAFDQGEKASQDDPRCVLYLSLKTGEWYVRPLAEFRAPRFKLIRQFLPAELDLLGQLRGQFYSE